MTAIKLNLTGIPSVPPGEFRGDITCIVDLMGLGIVSPSREQLDKLYEIPGDSKTVIHFKT